VESAKKDITDVKIRSLGKMRIVRDTGYTEEVFKIT
jgi:hypothetical protein